MNIPALKAAGQEYLKAQNTTAKWKAREDKVMADMDRKFNGEMSSSEERKFEKEYTLVTNELNRAERLESYAKETVEIVSAISTQLNRLKELAKLKQEWAKKRL